MSTKRWTGLLVIGTVIFMGVQGIYGMGKRPEGPVQEESEQPVQPSITVSTIEQPETLPQAPSAPVELASDKITRTKQIQTALTNAGYNPGPTDGKMGVKTISAIRDFQKANGLVVDGKVGSKTWAILGKFYARE